MIQRPILFICYISCQTMRSIVRIVPSLAQHFLRGNRSLDRYIAASAKGDRPAHRSRRRAFLSITVRPNSTARRNSASEGSPKPPGQNRSHGNTASERSPRWSQTRGSTTSKRLPRRSQARPNGSAAGSLENGASEHSHRQVSRKVPLWQVSRRRPGQRRRLRLLRRRQGCRRQL